MLFRIITKKADRVVLLHGYDSVQKLYDAELTKSLYYRNTLLDKTKTIGYYFADSNNTVRIYDQSADLYKKNNNDVANNIQLELTQLKTELAQLQSELGFLNNLKNVSVIIGCYILFITTVPLYLCH